MLYTTGMRKILCPPGTVAGGRTELAKLAIKMGFKAICWNGEIFIVNENPETGYVYETPFTFEDFQFENL